MKRKIYKSIILFFKWISVVLLGIFLLVFIGLNISSTQRYIGRQATNFLNYKTEKQAHIGQIGLNIWAELTIKDVYLPDNNNDTLASFDYVSVDIHLWDLYHHIYHIESLDVENLRYNVYTNQNDSLYNFNYLLEAFSSPSNSNQTVKDTSQNFVFQIDAVNLSKVSGKYSDVLSGLYFQGDIGTAEITIDNLDLSNQRILFDDIKLNDTRWSLEQKQFSQPDSVSKPTNWFISVHDVEIENTKGHYIDQPNAIYLFPNISFFKSEGVTADIKTLDFAIKTLEFNDNDIRFYQGNAQVNPYQTKKETTSSAVDWHLNIGGLNMKDNYLVYYDSIRAHERNNHFDPSNIEIHDLNLDLSKLNVTSRTLDLHLDQFSIKTANQFEIKSFVGDFHLDSTHIDLLNHRLETSKSIINYSIKANFKNLDELLEKPELTEVKVFDTKGSVGRGDIEYFYPLKQVPEVIENIAFNVDLNGRLDHLNLKNFQVESKNQLVIDLNGKITGLPSIDDLTYDLTINKLMANIPGLQSTMHREINKSVTLPSWVDFNGTLKGTAKLFDGDLEMNSQLGQAKIIALVDITENRETYDVVVEAKKLELGRLTGQNDVLGGATFNFSAKGKYFDLEKLDAQANLEVKEISFGDQIIRNGIVSATWKNKEFTSILKLNEEYLDCEIKTKGKWQNNSLETINDFDIKNISLKSLAISQEEISVKSKFLIETQGISMESIVLKAEVKEGNLSHKSRDYFFSNSDLLVQINNEAYNIKLQSPLVNVNLESSFNLAEIPATIENHLNNYMDYTASIEELVAESKTFKFDLELLDTRMIENVFVPGLSKLKINKIVGEFDSKKHLLDIKAEVLHLEYDDFRVDSAKLKISSDENSLMSSLEFTELQASGFNFYGLAFTANASNNEMKIGLKLNNEQKVQKFGVSGILKKIEAGYSWHTLEEDLMFYYEKWNVSPENQIVYLSNDNFKVTDFEISKDKQSIAVNKFNEKGGKIEFKNFKLKTFSSIVFSDSALISGVLNGEVVLANLYKELEMTSDVRINNLAYGEDTLGNLDLKITNPETGLFTSDVKIAGHNQIKGKMSYKTSNEAIDGKFDITKIDLKTIEKYAGGSITDLSGKAEGNIEMAGTLYQPDLKGQLMLNNSSFHLVANNNTYKIDKSKLTFTQNKLILESLKLQDKDGHQANVNGFITLENFIPNQLNIDINTQAFSILNTKASKDELYFGNVSMTSNIKMRGTLDSPDIDVKLSLAPGSDMTVVVPKEELEKEEYKNVVEFVDFSKPKKELEIQKERTTKSEMLGVHLKAKVEVNPDVTLRLLIDPIAGDYVEIQGSAYLTFELETDGNMKLVGLYTVKDGHYQMNYYNLIKRKFNFNEGSTVTWSGDPLNARLNINSSYSTKASPLPLVQSQLPEAETNSFRQTIPVDVVLDITGEMLSPNLDFDIKLPKNSGVASYGVLNTKLEQLRNSESEMNKQVFSLLILNRFIPEDFSQGSASNSLSNTARGSVSQVISDQFNALAGNYIKAVNINFNVDSYTDYSNGQAEGRTDLEVELSKTVFNDRLIVSVGSDLNVEGQDNQQESTGFVGDVKAEYLLSEGGQYRLKIYRENEYAGAIDGNLTVTGFSFILAQDFNKLFKKEPAVEPAETTK